MNHLAGQTSPYLLQHLNNPVDWYPWGEEALAKARAEGKPIFLSVGYSACHWCHVMERESFENPAVADYLNEHFVSVKVDREERPDLDDLYMGFVQRTTGAGGWPMTVFLTPERLPFHGGTYYPPEDRFGRPGFPRLLEAILEAWNGRREEVEQAAGQYAAMLAPEFPPLAEPRSGDAGSAPPVPAAAVEAFHAAARRELAAVYDPQWGGFGGAPKFPRAADLRFLMLAADGAGGGSAAASGEQAERAPLAMASHTLKSMAAGGMYDQLAGGFARYSVDERWLIPHFEKMLYDQGTLLPAYVEAWEPSGEARFAEVVRGTCEYLLRERRDPGGAFLASSDADSEGVEGRYFAWTPGELIDVLGEERGRIAAELYGVTEQGSFEHGTSVLVRAMEPEDLELAEEIRIALLSAREQRVAPDDDDKILTGWNGLAIEGLAAAGRVFGEAQWTEAARRAALFLCDALRGEDGRWRRSWRAGKAQHRALLEDYAYLCRGLLALFQAGGEERWLHEAEALGTRMLEDFLDERSGIFFDTDGEDASLLHRLASPWDGATPSPNGVALECLAMLHAFTQEPRWREALLRGAAAVLPMAAQQPRAFTGSARALQWAAEEPGVAVVIGTGSPDSLEDWRTALRRPEYREALPVLRAAPAPDSALPLFTERAPHSGGATLFLCNGATCAPPDDRPFPTIG